MKQRKHKVLDHPILGYFILMIFALVFTALGSPLDSLLARIIPGLGMSVETVSGTAVSASAAGVALSSLLALLVFKLWFRPDFSGCISGDYIVQGILIMLPALLVHYVGSVVSWITFGTGSVLVAFLRALAPGVSEEVTFRGLGVANYMRTIRDADRIPVIFWLSSIVFGLSHLGNIAAGGDVFSVIVQSVYAVGIGMLFAAVYLRTGNLLVTILAHTSVDFLELIRADLSGTGGVMTSTGVGDWITIAAGAIAAAIGLRAIAKKHYPEIMKIWNAKWNRAEQVPEADGSASPSDADHSVS